jgi:integrase
MRPEHKNDPSDHLGALISVVSFERQDLVAELLTEADVKTLKHLARKGTPENSLRALTSDLAYLEAWCLAATGTVLPWPTPEALALKFIAHHLYDAEERKRDPDHGMPAEVEAALKDRNLLRTSGPQAPATVRRRLSSWATLHRLRGEQGAFGSGHLREAVKRAAKAADRPRTRKSRKAITREVLEDLLETCKDGSPASLRDRALLMVAFGSGGRRRSELSRLKVDHLTKEAPVPADPADPQSPMLRCYSISLGRTKTTDAEEGRAVKLVGRPAEALAEWLESENIEDGYVFRNIDRWENVSNKAISPAGVNHMIKRRLEIAGYDETDYSAHGLRAGYLTQAAKDGVPLPEAMRQSQHKSVQQASNYYNDAEAELSRAARLME